MVKLTDRSIKIANTFHRYVETTDKTLIENYTIEEIEATLLQYHADKGWPHYIAMENRLAELKEIRASKIKKRELLVQNSNNKLIKYKEGIYWSHIQEEYEISKKEFGLKINFVKDKFKRKIIFRDVEQAYVLSIYGFNKPALILAGAVIEELLRLYLLSKGLSLSDNKFAYYITCCEKNGLLKKVIRHQTTVARLFRNIVHLENEKNKKHSISIATAKGAIASIFTIANDF